MQSQPEKPPIPKPPAPPKQFAGLKKTSPPETPKKLSTIDVNHTKTLGFIMSIFGFLIMVLTLIEYKTTVCKQSIIGEYDCIYNDGLIAKKDNLIMFGGFIFLSGCVLFSNQKH